ncbi:MAG: universal stress protein [Vulcanimicrobiota bacterium]
MNRILAVIKDTSEFSVEIIKIAAMMSKTYKASLYVTYVYEVPFSLELNEDNPGELERGDAVLDKANRVLEDLEVRPETHIIQARTAAAGILDEINDLNIDVVIMGMRHEPFPGELPIGGTSEYILKATNCQVILIRPGLMNEEK